MSETANVQPSWSAVAEASGGRFVPVAGGVLILDDDQRILGAVGVSGASSTDDQAAAMVGIEAAGWQAGLEPETVPDP